MHIPASVFHPSFNITRASHVVMTVKDLAASKHFYTELAGLIVSGEDKDTVYLRGLEEACHHSLVLKRASGKPQCERIGMRVFTEQDLDKAAEFYRKAGLPVKEVSVPFQGRTIHVSDPSGMPLEFCATMTVMPRMVTAFRHFKGGSAHRLDHYQVLASDVQAQCEFYMKQGFRLSEYIVADHSEEFAGVFLQRKGNPHDLVFFTGAGPRLHHFAYTSIDAGTLMRACDIAGNLGIGNVVERGPGRHGPGHAQFVYFRDPDGHRVELFTTHYQIMDIECEPIRWDANSQLRKEIWGLPAQRSWIEEATEFSGVPTAPPKLNEPAMTLERFLASRG
ncbi:MAG TPA: VOC family protein [Xanthobacteraceae bacterium]|nr:VOC family protein [Xanthobacteraceae bacterium]